MRTTNGTLCFQKRLAKSLVIPVLLTGGPSAKAPHTNPSITVQVYNWAAVEPHTLVEAEGEATRVFRSSGVAAMWLNCPLTVSAAQANPICIEPCPQSRFAVRIILEVPEDHRKTSLGVAMSESGVYATIFSLRVNEYASQRIASASQILGHAMVHELGHLLLGPVPHARFGIMRGQWTSEDLRSMAMGACRFSSEQSALIRQAAARREQRQTVGPDQSFQDHMQ